MTFIPSKPLTAPIGNRWSVITLLVANGLPLIGVLFFGWRAFDVVFLYWLENVILGAINVLKMLTCQPDQEASAKGFAQLDKPTRKQFERYQTADGGMNWGASKWFFVPFFTVHYGIFCLVHGVFVCVLMSRGGPLSGDDPFSTAAEVLQRPGTLIVGLALLASHLVSYLTNYLGRGEYRRLTPVELMIRPYGRVVVLHIAILLSGMLTVLFGSPLWLLVLLVIGKTALDLKLHLREHARV